MKYHKGWNLLNDSGIEEMLYFQEDTDVDTRFIANFSVINWELVIFNVFTSMEPLADFVHENVNLVKSFEDWEDPTPEEVTLFEIEYGIEYPDQETLKSFVEASR